MSSIEQHANIKFCVLLQKSPSETLEMLKKAYGNDGMKKMAVYKWRKRFCEGQKPKESDVEDSDDVIENAPKQLKDLSKNGFQERFEELYERWKKCVDAGGKYSEGQ
ncbi:hypothetical protein AVEN_97363-1 [Araneus ventricosus]|uniref:Mos1 transposase HTH domain-containing protein n=1 Tax=Araneus ventricosus TaxID=182803 RepID=A0A4Y2JC60_ARAVE|nr:hypothetical protein AVEN_97363-1 [Araneus ventricosus]